MIAKLIALMKELGILPPEKEKTVTEALTKLDLEKTPTKDPEIDLSKITDPALKELIAGLKAQVNSVGQTNKELVDVLTAERKAREEAAKTLADEAKKAQAKKVTDLTDKAKKDQKVPTAKEKWFRDWAEKDYEAAENWLKDAPVDKHAAPPPDDKSKQTQTGDDKAAKVAGPLGSVNSTILKNVLEQSSAAKN